MFLVFNEMIKVLKGFNLKYMEKIFFLLLKIWKKYDC